MLITSSVQRVDSVQIMMHLSAISLNIEVWWLLRYNNICFTVVVAWRGYLNWYRSRAVSCFHWTVVRFAQSACTAFPCQPQFWQPRIPNIGDFTFDSSTVSDGSSFQTAFGRITWRLWKKNNPIKNNFYLSKYISENFMRAVGSWKWCRLDD